MYRSNNNNILFDSLTAHKQNPLKIKQIELFRYLKS